jgi:hypothetical protein
MLSGFHARMRRSEALAGLAAAALTGCAKNVSGLSTARGTSSAPTAFGSQIYPSDDIGQTLTLLSGIGSSLIRVTADNGNFPYFDALFPAASALGIRVIVISDYAPQPVDPVVYAADAVTFQQRYASYNPIWELWNEPNLAHYWGAPPDRDAYAALAIATATALRNAGARQVLSGGTSGVDLNWIYGLRTRGVLDAVTGCAVHSYIDPNAALNTYLQALSLMPPGVTIYTTEACVSTGQPGFFQGMWQVHRYLGLPMLIWCEFRDGTAGSEPPYTDPMGLVTASYVPKPVYYTAKGLIAGP